MTNLSRTGQHPEGRTRGRGRRAFWLLLAVALVAVVWAGRVNARQHGRFVLGGPSVGSSLVGTPLAFVAEALLTTHAGVTPAQAERLAGLIRAKAQLSEDLESRRRVLESRLEAALGAEALDPDELVTLQEDARRLAADAADEVLIALVQLHEQLTPEQRAALVGHRRRR